MARRNRPNLLHGTTFPRNKEDDIPTAGGVIIECFEEDGITTFLTTRGPLECTSDGHDHFITVGGVPVKLLGPSDE